MSIKYPLRIVGTAAFRSIVDADNRAIAGGLLPQDAEEIVSALNAQPRKKSKKVQIEEQLKRSDLTAQEVGRDDIEYGHFDSLPRGEHVARMKR